MHLWVLNAVSDTLSLLTDEISLRYPGTPIVYSGGVMSCSVIKDRLSGTDRFFAPPEFSSDNAAGIAYLARSVYQGSEF